MNFKPDKAKFKKRIIIMHSVTVSLMVILIAFSSFNAANNDFRLPIILGAMTLILFLVFRGNLKRQMKILDESVIRLEEKTMVLENSAGLCETVPLDEVEKIYIDSLFGQTKLILVGKTDWARTYIDIENMQSFTEGLEKAAGIKSEKFPRNWREIGIKTGLIYIPSIITLIFALVYKFNMNMNIFFLVFTLNSLFCVYNLSEKKTFGGIPAPTSRRMIIILAFLFAYLFVRTFQVS